MDPLQKASLIRKVYYLGAILALFTVSMFWRGIIPIPLSDAARASEPRTGIYAVADKISSHTILNQSRTLDLRELEQGDPEVEGTFVRLALTGSNGFMVTYLWHMAQEKQKRNDFHEMEEMIRIVTRLQPHFIAPWIFQSWNIAYNVSVEMQGSGDMYHYIARGIDLLAEGERRNSHIYEGRRIGSPDMRKEIGFYYMNKFGVSDQVEVLRCLFQLSCMSPDDRNPDALIDKATNTVDLAKFRDFCIKYPHLVRRLRGEDIDAANKSDEKTKQKIQEALKCPLPEHIVQFLRENREIPTRYKFAKELADPDKQFPVVPPKFNEGPNEANPASPMEDDFTAYKAARAWYAYSMVPVPPNPLDIDDQPLPSDAPRPSGKIGELKPGEYDPLRYRVPRSPMLIIFRQFAPLAQTKQAEMEQKEGWYDAEGWRIDDPQDPQKWWFPDPDAPAGAKRPLNLVVGAKQAWSLEEWKLADAMWREHGQRYGLTLTLERLRRYEEAAQGFTGGMPGEPTDEEMADREQRRRYEAKVAMFFYPRNRSVTNFPYFLASSQAEARVETVTARKILWQAEQARKLGRTQQAIKFYEDGLNRWKAVLAKDANFHRPEHSDRTEEDTYTYELTYLRLIVQDDERVRDKANELANQIANVMRTASVVLPFQPCPFVASLPYWSKGATTFVDSVISLAWGCRFLASEWKKDALEDMKWYVAETQFSPFAKNISEQDGVTDRERLNTPWIRADIKNAVRTSQGVQKKQPQEAGPVGPGAPQAPTTK